MRWLLLAALVAFSPLKTFALDTTADDASSVVAVPEAGVGVTIAAIPAPMPVIEVLRLDGAGAVKKPRLARKKPSPVMMLSRTERRQVQILVADNRTHGLPGQSYNPNDDFQGSPDELDFHRSYSRPRLVVDADDVDDDQELSAHVRLRLLMARLKALEVHALNQVPDTPDDLSDSVLERLKAARLKAVEAHQAKFS